MILYTETKDIPLQDLVELYQSVAWTAYTSNPNNLQKSISNSAFVLIAQSETKLVGLARCLSDDCTILRATNGQP